MNIIPNLLIKFEMPKNTQFNYNFLNATNSYFQKLLVNKISTMRLKGEDIVELGFTRNFDNKELYIFDIVMERHLSNLLG